MYAPIYQIQYSPNDEDEERDDVVGDCEEPRQESFLSYYNHNFEQPAISVMNPPECADYFACFNNAVSTPSNSSKISCDFAPKKKRKSETAVNGGRVVRVAGRKDRHSKVVTAKGPRDRRLRLSPTTAIGFYDVLDRLGYDRPSKAIDWLLKKAKSAIDALQEQQSTNSTAPAEYLSLSQRGMREEHERSNHGSPFSGFTCFVDEEAPPSAAAYLDQNGCCSALNSTPQIFGTNWEMARLQKMFTWNSVNESSGNARGGHGGAGGEGAEYYSLPPQPILGHTNMVREPLQSSITNYASSINDDFAGFNFSDELSQIVS